MTTSVNTSPYCSIELAMELNETRTIYVVVSENWFDDEHNIVFITSDKSKALEYVGEIEHMFISTYEPKCFSYQ
jgi:hypothetical protein